MLVESYMWLNFVLKTVEENKYCCPDSEVLKNKLNIRDKDKLFAAEKKEL